MWLTRQGEINFGEITAFLLYTIYVAHALGAFSTQGGEFMRAVGASERIFQVRPRRRETAKSDVKEKEAEKRRKRVERKESKRKPRNLRESRPGLLAG